jgi:hypothetical protein
LKLELVKLDLHIQSDRMNGEFRINPEYYATEVIGINVYLIDHRLNVYLVDIPESRTLRHNLIGNDQILLKNRIILDNDSSVIRQLKLFLHS